MTLDYNHNIEDGGDEGLSISINRDDEGGGAILGILDLDGASPESTNNNNHNEDIVEGLLKKSFDKQQHLPTIAQLPGVDEIPPTIISTTTNNNNTTTKKPQTLLPKMKIFSIFIIMLCDAINSLSLFPYVNFMVEDFHLTSNDKTLGYYVGFLASSYYASQLFSSFFWGWFSNYKGRRPSVLMGLVGSMICMMCFGFSQKYEMALAFRFLSGLVNGNVAVSKTMLGEITDSSNQARAFSFIGLSWSIGGIVAPLIGGLFSNVCKTYPSYFDSPDSILCRFPYMLPNIICVIFSGIGFVLAWFYLAESKTFTIKYSKSSVSLAKKYRQSLSSGPRKIPSKLRSIFKSVRILFKSTMGTFNLLNQDDIKDDQLNNNNNNNRDNNIKKSNGLGDDDEFEIVQVDLDNVVDDKEEEEEEEEDLSDNPRGVWELIKDKPVLYSCIIYAMLGFMFTIFEEGFPVWSPIVRTIDPETGKPEGGGYGFQSRHIGILQSSAGIFALFIQTLVFPTLIKWIGLVKAFRLSLLIVLPAWIILPELSRLTIAPLSSPTTAQHPTIFWILLFPTYLFQSFASEISFIAIIVMISNSALPKDMAIVNSIGMFLVSISRTCGPVIGSSLLAFTVSHNLPYPLDYHFLFVLLTIIAFVLFGTSFKLPLSLNFTKEESSIELENIE